MTTGSPESAGDVPSAAPRVIAVTGGKGGVGKSTIAVNLALSLARANRRVCLLDADTGLANVNILLGLKPRYGLEHVVFGAKPLEEVMLTAAHGLCVIPGANGISECVELMPRQQLRLIGELARLEREFDYLVLDTPAGIADSTLDCVASAHQVLLVITPELTSLTDAFSMVRLLERRRPMQYQVVVNMCRSRREGQAAYRRFSQAVARFIGARISCAGCLVTGDEIRQSVARQEPVALLPQSNPCSAAFHGLGRALEKALVANPPKPSFSAFWKSRCEQRQHALPATTAANDADNVESDQETAFQALAARLLAELPRVGREVAAPVLAALNDAARGRPDRATVDLEAMGAFLRRKAPRPLDAEPAISPAKPNSATACSVAAAMTTALQSVLPSPAGPTARGFGYDAGRFGTQEALVDALRRNTCAERSTMELVEALGRQ